MTILHVQDIPDPGVMPEVSLPHRPRPRPPGRSPSTLRGRPQLLVLSPLHLQGGQSCMSASHGKCDELRKNWHSHIDASL